MVMKRGHWILLWVALLPVFLPTRANALIDIGSDFLISGLVGQDIQIRTHNFVMVKLGSVSLGGVLYFEPMHSYLTDVIYGVGARFGQEFFLEIDAGLFNRTFEGGRSSGYAFAILFGRNFSKNFRLSVPILVKYLPGGSGSALEQRWIIDLIPYFGLRVEL